MGSRPARELARKQKKTLQLMQGLKFSVAEQKGLEPSASGVTGQRYNRLNYCSADVVGGTGLEPVTAGL